jgi:hypothetical protein
VSELPYDLRVESIARELLSGFAILAHLARWDVVVEDFVGHPDASKREVTKTLPFDEARVEQNWRAGVLGDNATGGVLE